MLLSIFLIIPYIYRKIYGEYAGYLYLATE